MEMFLSSHKHFLVFFVFSSFFIINKVQEYYFYVCMSPRNYVSLLPIFYRVVSFFSLDLTSVALLSKESFRNKARMSLLTMVKHNTLALPK